MKTIALTLAALVASSAIAEARTARRAAPAASASYERVAPPPAWTAPLDNVRPAFAAHVSANGQGVN